MSWADWWVWMAGAFLLGIVELMVPGFVFLGLALGAGAVGVLLLVGGPGAAMLTGSLPLLLVIFAVISIVAYVILRRAVGVQKGQVKTFDHDVND
ncbi:MAG: hypothetical protein AAF871_15355 [Pseudomonadota bacterium]